MTDLFQQIYATEATRYEELVHYEDYQGQILPALQAIRPLAGVDVVELGAGTGRLTTLVLPLVGTIVACDNSAHMLAVARQKLAQRPLAPYQERWATVVCDNRAVAVADKTADVMLTGWSLGHFTGWHRHNWHQEMARSLAEMKRILRPGGTIIILETQGTNQESPAPPTPELRDYYHWLEAEQGFETTSIRTDYRFDSVAQAVALMRFFFGDEMAAAVQRQNEPIVPECTGIWWRSF